jgi:hypothetical protein
LYRSTSCGTLGKSSVSQLLPRLLFLKLQCGLFLWNLTVSRSTSSLEDRENFLEGPVAPFHHSTDMGDLGGRTKSVIRILARTLKFPVEFTPSSTLWFERERGNLSEFFEEYPQTGEE